MADAFTMALEGDLSQSLDTLDAGIREQVLRSAAHAGAQFLQDVAKSYAPVYIPQGVTRRKIRPGQLRDSIYRVFSKSQSTEMLKLYEVSWNHTQAPHGYWMENGFWLTKGPRKQPGKQTRVRWVQGKGFIRHAGDRSDEALRIATARAAERLLELVSAVASKSPMSKDVLA